MKNKKVLIISTIFIILIVAVVLVIMYFTTDLFKNNQQLFYKYLAQTKIFDSNFIEQYEITNDRIKTNSNSSSAEINVLTAVQNKETEISDIQKVLNVRSNALENVLLKQSYRDFVFSNNNRNFLTLKYIRDNNTHAITADNILVKYLSLENSNLKEFFAKLGVEDTTNIPNSIPTNYEEILKIDQTTLNNLKEVYGTLIYNNIDEGKFYKLENEDKTQTIGISLTEQEACDLLRLILDTAKNDNILLNLIISKAQLLGYNNLTVENIQTKIQSYIEVLQERHNKEGGFAAIGNNDYAAKKDVVIKIELIKRKKEVIGFILEENYTEQIHDYGSPEQEGFILSEQKVIKKIEINFSKTNEISISVKKNDVEILNSIINYFYDQNNIKYSIGIEIKEDENIKHIKTEYQINNYHTDNIIQKTVIDINTGTEENYQINLTNNITFKQDIQISKLTTENSAKLNDMTSEELSQLFIALTNRIMTLYGLQINNITR